MRSARKSCLAFDQLAGIGGAHCEQLRIGEERGRLFNDGDCL
jgi:hypothetical protein